MAVELVDHVPEVELVLVVSRSEEDMLVEVVLSDSIELSETELDQELEEELEVLVVVVVVVTGSKTLMAPTKFAPELGVL